MSKSEISKGLAFMLATAAAMPRTLGDRDRTSAMTEAMSIAVRNRFAFQPEDAKELKRLNIDTCVGVFRPLDLHFYYLACEAGGTYPRLWEQAHGIKAWRAAKAVHTHWSRPTSFVDDSRVCTGVAVLLPPSFAKEEQDLASYQGLQVWWVTDFTDQTINLCRYKPSDISPFRKPGGAPARRRQLTREEWATYQAHMKKIEGDDVSMKWTVDNDLAACSQGWAINTCNYRNPIIYVPLLAGGFKSNEEALEFVRAQAAAGDATALRGLMIHERGQKLPERPVEQPDPEGTELIELDV